ALAHLEIEVLHGREAIESLRETLGAEDHGHRKSVLAMPHNSLMTAASDTDTQRKLSELSFLREIAQLASSTRDWDEMLRIVIDRTTDAMRAEVSSLYLVEKRDG